MALPTPKLDDRTFQAIVDEAKSRIPRYCPEWTDHNLSDPGVTLIELFAWMTELIIYRLNQVPDKNYVKFLEMVGIKLLSPRAANVEVTFRLSAPQSTRIVLPRGTEVATVRTETEEAIIFTTDSDLVIDVPNLVECLATADGSDYQERMLALEVAEGEFLAFDPKPKPENALLMGFGGDLGRDTLVLDIDCEIEGIGVAPDNPPLSWEAWLGEDEWQKVEIVCDTTGGFNRHGFVEMILPPGLAGAEFGGKYAHVWIRCRVTSPLHGQPFYERSPKIGGIVPRTIGGTIPATHSTVVSGEFLGRSSGKAGQSFQLRNGPILDRREGESVEISHEDEQRSETWVEVEDFADSDPEDKHYVCDPVHGQISFGPAIRQPDGTVRQHGAIPPSGAGVRFSAYRYGGGVIGNVAAGTITVVKSSIPYVAGVANRKPARGGADAESLERAKLRAPKLLRTRHRAVTAEDFEYFALTATTAVRRAKCLGAVGSSDSVVLCVVPSLEKNDGHLLKQDLTIHPDVKEEIRQFLDERCLITVRSVVEDAKYVWVTVEADVYARPGSDIKQVKHAIERHLHEYLDPFTGGLTKTGWPFGRDLAAFELFPLIQEIFGVESVALIRLLTSMDLDDRLTDAGQQVALPKGGLICSGRHRVVVRESRQMS